MTIEISERVVDAYVRLEKHLEKPFLSQRQLRDELDQLQSLGLSVFEINRVMRDYVTGPGSELYQAAKERMGMEILLHELSRNTDIPGELPTYTIPTVIRS